MKTLTPTQQVIGIILTLFFFPFALHRIFIPNLGEVRSILILDLTWVSWVFLITFAVNPLINTEAYLVLLSPIAIVYCIFFIRDLIRIYINKF